MHLADYFLQLAATYDRSEGLHSEAQTMLSDAGVLLDEHTPPGIVVRAGGGKGMATYTPWVGFFDPDVTDTAQRGIYVVYLLSEDLEVLNLSLNQGMEYLRQQLGDSAAKGRLSADARAIRGKLTENEPLPFDQPIVLRSRGPRQRAYEAGNISCRTYAVGALPSEESLQADLRAVLQLYEQAVDAKADLLLHEPGSVASPVEEPRPGRANPLIGFRPKDESDYRAVLQGRELIKSRRHEGLLRRYVNWTTSQGWTASLEHPQDVVLRVAGQTYVVEAKVIYKEVATDAVRAAVGQLLTYAYFLHPHSHPPGLVALFSEEIGTGYASFLTSVGVVAVWWSDGRWRGTNEAVLIHLAEKGWS